MIENALDGISELRHVKNSSYTSTRINSKDPKCTVYQHEINSDENNEEYDQHVDTNIEDLIIKFTNLNVTKQTQNAHVLS